MGVVKLIEIDTLEYQQTEKIETELKDVDLPAGSQLVFTLNNRFFRHQACYSLLPAKPGGQADRVISLCKYKVVG
jgi:hypothetical protein